MQDRPDKEVLLDAVARFLVEQVRPAITDPGLSFRVLIAANMANIVATEIRTGEAQDAAERKRLSELLADAGERPTRELNATLAARLKAGTFDAESLQRVAAHLKQTLIEKLAVTNPRFDTSLDIEG